MNFYRYLSLSLVPCALVAQASFMDRFRTETPVIDKMVADLQYPEALQKVEALIPTQVEPFDKSRLNLSYTSYQRLWATSRTYYTASNVARLNGQWEKALEYNKKAVEMAKENAEATKETLTKGIENLKQDSFEKKGQVLGNAEYINTLKQKPKLTPVEEQQMKVIQGLEESLVSNEKWAGIFQKAIDHAAGEAASLTPSIEVLEKSIADQNEQLEKYRFKNDKPKFVEGIISSKPYMDSIKAQGPAEELAFLFRLAVLDPQSKRVQRAIAVLQGKPVEPEPEKGKKKGK